MEQPRWLKLFCVVWYYEGLHSPSWKLMIKNWTCASINVKCIHCLIFHLWVLDMWLKSKEIMNLGRKKKWYCYLAEKLLIWIIRHNISTNKQFINGGLKKKKKSEWKGIYFRIIFDWSWKGPHRSCLFKPPAQSQVIPGCSERRAWKKSIYVKHKILFLEREFLKWT